MSKSGDGIDIKRLYKDVMGREALPIDKNSKTCREISIDLEISLTMAQQFIRKCIDKGKLEKVRKSVDGRSVPAYREI